MMTQEEFNVLVFNKGWVRSHDNETVVLDGEFDKETLEAIIYAMNNHPEWLKLKDPS